MLEIKDQTEKESRHYLNYDANLVYKYKLKTIIVRLAIEEYGLQVYMGEEELETDKEDWLLKISIDERRDIYRFMERNFNFTEEQLAKELFRESEYYPG